jgi:hypothetical protein
MPESIAIIAIIAGILFGGATGSIITACVTNCRDKKKRRRAFIGFLEKWKADILTPNRGPTEISTKTNPVILIYDARLGDFREQVAIVRDIFSGTQEFEVLTNRLGSLKTEDWNKKNPRDVICGAIDALLEFAKKRLKNSQLL